MAVPAGAAVLAGDEARQQVLAWKADCLPVREWLPASIGPDGAAVPVVVLDIDSSHAVARWLRRERIQRGGRRVKVRQQWHFAPGFGVLTVEAAGVHFNLAVDLVADRAFLDALTAARAVMLTTPTPTTGDPDEVATVALTVEPEPLSRALASAAADPSDTERSGATA
jgi:hypothetical protein